VQGSAFIPSTAKKEKEDIMNQKAKLLKTAYSFELGIL
jgi:hypothetical protein